MTITKTCNTCEHYPNDKHCIGCEWDKSKGENSKWELEDNPIVIDRKVLEQIRAEIEGLMSHDDYMVDGFNVLDIIDKHISRKE